MLEQCWTSVVDVGPISSPLAGSLYAQIHSADVQVFWSNVGPTSQTVDRRCKSIGSIAHATLVKQTQQNPRRWSNAGLMLGRRLRCRTNHNGMICMYYNMKSYLTMFLYNVCGRTIINIVVIIQVILSLYTLYINNKSSIHS